MCCGQYLKNIFLWTLFFGLLLQEAYCLKCYVCVSRLGEDCDINPKQDEFIYNCSYKTYGFSSLMKPPGFRLPSNSNFSSRYNLSNLPTNLLPSLADCAVFVFKDRDGNTGINRDCAFEHIPCHVYVKLFAPYYTIEKCDRCDSDLCNSSMNLSFSYWSFFILVIITTNILR